MLRCLNCNKDSCVVVPDEEITGEIPSFTSRQILCTNCGVKEFMEADELGLDEWPDEARA
jgi:hypothetical protein